MSHVALTPSAGQGDRGTGGDGGDEEMVWSQDGSLQREICD